ncbi:MAG TPA: hypothetical protein VIF15_19230 [Polyangiaceae bacterium]
MTPLQIATQKVDVVAEFESLITGMNTELSTVDPIVLSDVSWPRATLVAKFQARLDAAEAVKTARTALALLVADEKAAQTEADPLRNAMRTFLKARLGKDSPKLQKFGFTPNRTPKPTAAAKAAGVQKAAATRKARGTSSKKAKAGISGSPAPSPTPAGKPPVPSTPGGAG